MAEQLYREQVERDIAEMWAALAATPRDESYGEAHQQAAGAERRLRALLARDEGARNAAVDLLFVAKSFTVTDERDEIVLRINGFIIVREPRGSENAYLLSELGKRQRAAIAKAEGGAS